ncbi:hypothetical protein IW143_003196 [Coemansia sp. RSA 520]|nr:hypothetical protein LPJ58_001465 [Coemansia sp. RSA 1591]KAJ1765119.1 hypothetical protein LPJ69_001448 [Coemansia sp. RSA 1752]KAJ1793211.1 hypothetical protein LPJ67_001338 [Coemansia sp. RSA 1938]KAJ2148818.1 hypothetical protein IW142_000595 [Coemansia sp. RSA 564]KAJ2171596.1 hypothetical protein GGH16_002773 [Coemansia sp. RSA 560]KAJ2218296.1 hypothetical protein IW143_003196 [Coemansia sp. RSA 520]KAJ2267617.1 hypothetical protein J3F81_005023 [Coemansia sp. RSA 371]KAJ2409979.1 
MKLFSYGCIAATAMILSSVREVEAYPVRLERRDPVTKLLNYVVETVHTSNPSYEKPSYSAPSYSAPSYSQPEYTAEASERRVLCLVNKERRRVGLNSVRIHPAMTKAAYDHSLYQSNVQSMTHDDPHYGSLGSRLKDSGFGFATAAENIAEAPAASPDEVFKMWMSDQGHYDNIVSPKSTYMGLACVNGFWTQDFGSEMDAPPVSQYEAEDVC